MSEEKLRMIEKLGEVVQKIVNPPPHSERYQQLSEAVDILNRLTAISRDIALQDMAVKGVTAALEDLSEKIKITQAFVIVAICLALAAIIINVIM